MRSRSILPLGATVAALPLVMLACNSQPIDPTVLAEQAALHAREVVHQSGGGVAFTQSSDSGLTKIMTGLAHTNSHLAGMAAMMPDMPVSMPPGMSAMGASPMAQSAMGMPTLSTTEEQFDDTADDLRTFIHERLLADTNLETKSADEAVYLLRGDPTCRALPRTAPAGTLPTLDTKCVDDLNRLKVRIVMHADGDGVRLMTELGDDKLELATFIVHSSSIAVEVDFAKAYTASKYAQQVLGNDSPMGGTQFEKLEGAIRLSLQKNGEKQVTFAAAVLSAIDVSEKTATGPTGPELKLAASDPLWALSLDGVAQTATIKVNMGALDVLTSWDPKGGAPENRDLLVAIGGLTGEATFKEGTDELVVNGLGIGPTAVKVRNASVFDLGLNSHDNNRFDLKLAVDSAGEAHFDVTPRFDLTIGTHFNVIAADYAADSQPPSYLLDEVYGVKLDNGGATATIESVPANASGTFSGGIKVDKGTLTISSSKVAQPITVPMNECLKSVSMPAADAHPILGAIVAATCQ